VKIILVADVSIQNVIGGAERVLFEQAKRLFDRGHTAYILCRRLRKHTQPFETICGVDEWRFGIKYNNAVASLVSSTRKAKILFEALHRKVNFDCINFHQPFSSFGVLQSAYAKNIPKVYTCHSLSFEEYISRNPKPFTFFKQLYFNLNIFSRKWIERRVLKQSDRIVALSRYTLDKLHTAHGISDQKVTIIPGAVDVDRFYPVSNKQPIRHTLGIPPDKVVLLTVRNLVARMGLGNLIHAMQRIIATIPDVELVIVGEGPLKPELESLSVRLGLRGTVRFTGYISESFLPDYYRMADFFVLPTRELEGFGLVTLESMACGVPVLGTSVGGTKEILGPFNPDFLFNDTTPDAMADLIIKTYRKMKNDPEWYHHVSRQCRRFVERNYSWERNVDALEGLFLKLVADKPC